MERILRSDWLPESAISGFPEVIPREKVLFFECNPLLAKLVWQGRLDIGLLFFAFLLTSTSSRSIKTKKKKNSNKANIHPS